MASALQLPCAASAKCELECAWRKGEQLRRAASKRSTSRCVFPDKKNQNGRSSVRAEGFDLWQVLGGRGLPGGEAGLKTDDGMKKLFSSDAREASSSEAKSSRAESEGAVQVDGYDSFNKEMSGLVGGFPGGEKGLERFLQVYPPPRKVSKELEKLKQETEQARVVKARTVNPPLLMPGMTVIVKEPRNPYYMFTGIVQRITDGRVAVIFEGGNWDKMVAFKLSDLERTKSGPPMTNPKSAVLLSTVNDADSS